MENFDTDNNLDMGNNRNKDYTVVRGSCGSILYLHNGYVFIKDMFIGRVIFVRCQKRYCNAKGRINLSDNTAYFTEDTLHGHAPCIVQE